MVESKQVRVNNWGIFFLQRLQEFFSKTDYCDLTLQFEGNVQLKVHRLVMCACTDYFSYLERTCPSLEESTIMMPPDLQADVIVPIVNFMYTGMLEFHMSIFDRLYKAAELMNISVLTKLLDAQKVYPNYKSQKKKSSAESPHIWNLQGPKTSKSSKSSDLPATLPGRKLPVWKRKNAPSAPMQHPASQLHFSEQRYGQDPLSVPDSTPKPTRFEWPDEDLPQISLMDTSFEEISYTSKPLLTQEEEIRASTSFDDIRRNSRSEDARDDGDTSDYSQQKRKLDSVEKSSPKRMKLNDKENKETTISIKSSNGSDLDHTKIVSEILKKYPQLVKKNKNIRLKIMASGNKNVTEQTIQSPIKSPKMKVQVESPVKTKLTKPVQNLKLEKVMDEGPWVCSKCYESSETTQEFVLYYLYRKHMTDVHNETFDSRLCKYCGQWCGKHNLMMYHLYTKHGLKPPTSYSFPICDRCPYIALSAQKLAQHKLNHDPNEMQCTDCQLAFTSQQTLTSHIQITGHLNRARNNTHDCQYCTKKLQSAINLFSHIKNSHLKEAKRDGIVILDENEDVMNEEEEDVVTQKDKVKIISNVKVPAQPEQHNASTQQQQLVSSTDAEALSNVASDIATSLGLVDIVVLDDNQQYILQQQEDHSGQPEFIIPDLTSNENHFSGQVMTTQHSTVLPQGMLQSTGADITSTDELVMVLTDHDYQDEQEGTTADNSNIVVLYSHPVDGQQSQFITSQGNLLVNSQTGMLEIRNESITTTAASQMMVNTVDTTESIESIQREIQSHRDVKQEPQYVEQPKANMPHIPQESTSEIISQLEETNETTHHEATNVDQGNLLISMDTLPLDQYQEAEEGSTEPADLNPVENNVEACEKVEEGEEETPVQEEAIREEPVDESDGTAHTLEEPMETDEVEETAPVDEPPSQQDTSIEQNPEADEAVPPSKDIKVEESEEGVDVPPTVNETQDDEAPANVPTLIFNDSSRLGDVVSAEDENEIRKSESGDVPEPMEVDGKTSDSCTQGTEEEEEEKATVLDEETCVEEKETVEVQEPLPESSEIKEPEESEKEVITNEADQQPHQEEASECEYQPQSETDNSQYNEDEDNSQSSQDTAQSQEVPIENRSQSNINQVILEDWEDTDSQQSEKQRVAMKQAAENVNKLMDDWEEEEEEDRREGD